MLRRAAVLALFLTALRMGAVAAWEAELTGRVLTVEGTPLAEAVIELRPLVLPWEAAQRQLRGEPEDEAVAVASSRPDGSFRIAAPAPGRWELVVRHPRYLPAVYELQPFAGEQEIPAVELPPRHPALLRVVDASDRPVAALRVLAESLKGSGKADPWRKARRAGWRPRIRQAVTSPEGSFVLATHPGETLVVAALDKDRFLYRKLGPGTDGVTLRLDENLVEAKLLTAAGRPAAGFVGLVQRPFLAFAVSGPEGEIAIPLKESKALQFADREGVYGRAKLEVRTVAGQVRRILRLPFDFETSTVLSGVVVDRHGRGLPGAEVTAAAEPDGFGPHREEDERLTATDAEGRFFLADLKRGTYTLFASAEGFEPGVFQGVEVRGGAETEDLGKLTLERRVTLRGRVLRPDGLTLEGALVRVRQTGAPGIPARELTAVSASDGSFEIGGFSDGSRLRLRASRESFQDTVLSDVRADSGEPLDVVLRPGVDVRGRVVDPRHSEVHASVELRRELDGKVLGFTAETDAGGSFRLPAQAPGRVTLSARSRDGRAEATELELGADEADVTLVLVPSALLRGHVFAPDGGPMAGARLVVERQGDGSPEIEGFADELVERSGEDGGFELPGLDPGGYILSADHPEFEPVTDFVDVPDSGEREVEVFLSERRRRRPVSGQVLDPTGAGLFGATVELLAQEGTVTRTASRRDGGFEVLALRDGAYSLLVTHPDFASRRTPPFSVAGGGVGDLRVQLERGGTLRGEVLGVRLEDLCRLTVVAHRAGFGGRPGRLDSDGWYRIPNLPPGEWQVTARLQDPSRTVSGKATLAPGEEAILDLRFDVGYRLSGFALSGGQPLAGARLTLLCPQASYHGRTSSDAAGWFGLEEVPSAVCTLRLWDPRSGSATREDLTISGDTVIEVDAGGG